MEPQEHQFTVHRCPLAANGRSEEILDGRYECDWVNIHQHNFCDELILAMLSLVNKGDCDERKPTMTTTLRDRPLGSRNSSEGTIASRLERRFGSESSPKTV